MVPLRALGVNVTAFPRSRSIADAFRVETPTDDEEPTRAEPMIAAEPIAAAA